MFGCELKGEEQSPLIKAKKNVEIRSVKRKSSEKKSDTLHLPFENTFHDVTF